MHFHPNPLAELVHNNQRLFWPLTPSLHVTGAAAATSKLQTSQQMTSSSSSSEYLCENASPFLWDLKIRSAFAWGRPLQSSGPPKQERHLWRRPASLTPSISCKEPLTFSVLVTRRSTRSWTLPALNGSVINELQTHLDPSTVCLLKRQHQDPSCPSIHQRQAVLFDRFAWKFLNILKLLSLLQFFLDKLNLWIPQHYNAEPSELLESPTLIQLCLLKMYVILIKELYFTFSVQPYLALLLLWKPADGIEIRPPVQKLHLLQISNHRH